jgi:putative Ca2+/H+ antiporter (TMEM165/GDT1 family)
VISLDVRGHVSLRVAQVASLVFAAEWGDRSMLAVIALAAGGTNALCVGIGALSGHFAATLIAVMGGALIGKHVSDKMIGYSGGVLFLVFAVLTILGVC